MTKDLIPQTIEYFQTAKENQYFDRKEARIEPKAIVRHLVAFANAGGGRLVIGINDAGKITGFKQAKSHPIEEYQNAHLTYIRETPIRVDSSLMEVINASGESDHILVLEVFASYNRVIRTHEHKVYLRQNDKSVELNFEEQRQLSFDKGERHFEDEIIDRSSVDDVDEEIMDLYHEHMDIPQKATDEILEARGMLLNGHLTTAGILVFAKNPSKYLPQARLKFIRYEGTSANTGRQINIVKEKTFDACIPRIIREASEFIRTQMRELQFLNDHGIFEKMPEYPEFAWFEGMVNALTHRNYSMSGEHIKFIMFDDRLEIYSPGLLPNMVTLENIMTTRYSRNPKIARILSEFGWVKEMNEGVKRIYSEMQKVFLKDPQYSETNHQVLLCLENNILSRKLRVDEAWRKKLSEEVRAKLNMDETRILQYLVVNGRITSSDAAKLTGRSRVTAQRILQNLTKKKILRWYGTNKNDPTQYYLLDLN